MTKNNWLFLFSCALGALLLILIAEQSRGATYYIDYATGSDSNAGTSKSTPWKRQPYMVGFSGSYNHAAGDQFIFKGGVSWPRGCYEMVIHAGGTATAADYYGVDPTWFSGSQWPRPIFDGQNIAMQARVSTDDGVGYIT